MGSFQITVPVISLMIFTVCAACIVALVISGHTDESEFFRIIGAAAVGAGLGVAIPKPSSS